MLRHGMCLALFATLVAFPGAAQNTGVTAWPDRVVKVVVPYGAGGGVDLFTRPIINKLSEQTGAQLIVDNRPGAGGTIGVKMVARSQPDGYTILGGGVVRVSGFGQTGPYRERSGFGSLAEAMTGFAYTNGFPDRPPVLPGIALADSSTGLAGAFLTLAALQARATNGGRGQVVDLPIYESLLTLTGPQVIEYDQLGLVQERTGGRLPMVSPRNTFRTRDEKWIAVSAGTRAVFERLCRALDLPEVARDPRFTDNQARRVHADVLEEILQGAVSRFDQDELVRRFTEHDAPAAPVYSVAELVNDPHFVARENITRVWDEELGCEMRMQNVIGRLSATPGAITHAGPALGADNRSILIEELGFSEKDLREAGIAV